MRRPLIDQRLYAKTMTHWPSLCDIQSISEVRSDSNQLIASNPVAVANMTQIPCSLAPLSITPTDNEVRSGEISSGKVGRILKLNGFFPGITNTMQAVVDGVTYQIVGIEADSHSWSTRLKVENILNG